jgi:hypothetical protein
MASLVLTGLDGANPLGFLAALGALNVLADQASSPGEVTLGWTYRGAWRPVVTSGEGETIDSIVAHMMADVATWKKEPAIDLEYEGVRDLKPPPEAYRTYLERLAGKAEPRRRRSVDFAAAFASDVAEDNSGKTKPTALHFTSGQQKFLAMVRELVGGLTPDDVREALVGPWRYDRTLPVLRWDSTVTREHALSAAAPADEKPTGVPAADWLAFRALSLFPVAPRSRRLETTGFSFRRGEAYLTWPLWSSGLSRDTVRSVLAHPGLVTASERERRALGVEVMLEARVRRSNKGYGNFNPAAVL